MKKINKEELDYYRIKFPITSSITQEKYKVKIKPYRNDDTQYSNGCIVELYKPGFIFDDKLYNLHCNNNNGKIEIDHVYRDVKTDIDYNLVNIAKLIVNRYEKGNRMKIQSKTAIKKDYNDFKEWNGVV